MQTFKYKFPAVGHMENTPTIMASMLQEELANSSECLMSYCIFPTDSDILDKVTIDTDNNGNIRAINLHTYTELWDDCEDEFTNCVKENLVKIAPDIMIEGNAEALGREGSIPAALYHIAERNDLEDIMTNGLIPGTGSNNYKDMEDHVYLADEKDLAPWLAVLKHKNNPVILEINTGGLKGIETGRMFKDRDYIPGGYGEYRTLENIPAAAIKEADLNNGLGDVIRSQMTEQFNNISSENDRAEVMTGLNRLQLMGVIDTDYIDKLTAINDMKHNCSNTAISVEDDEGLPWAEADEELPWAKEVKDDFTKAINAMSIPDDNLSQ